MKTYSRTPFAPSRTPFAPVRIPFLLGLLAPCLGLSLSFPLRAEPRQIIVASKPFTESYLLSEMLAQIIDAEGEASAVRKFGLGGPTLVVDAIKSGTVDLEDRKSVV